MAAEKLKHSEGDFVKIIDNSCMHCIPNGTVVEVDRIKDWGNGFFSYEVVDLEGDRVVFDDDDCEGVK